MQDDDFGRKFPQLLLVCISVTFDRTRYNYMESSIFFSVSRTGDPRETAAGKDRREERGPGS